MADSNASDNDASSIASHGGQFTHTSNNTSGKGLLGEAVKIMSGNDIGSTGFVVSRTEDGNFIVRLGNGTELSKRRDEFRKTSNVTDVLGAMAAETSSPSDRLFTNRRATRGSQVKPSTNSTATPAATSVKEKSATVGTTTDAYISTPAVSNNTSNKKKENDRIPHELMALICSDVPTANMRKNRVNLAASEAKQSPDGNATNSSSRLNDKLENTTASDRKRGRSKEPTITNQTDEKNENELKNVNEQHSKELIKQKGSLEQVESVPDIKSAEKIPQHRSRGRVAKVYLPSSSSNTEQGKNEALSSAEVVPPSTTVLTNDNSSQVEIVDPTIAPSTNLVGRVLPQRARPAPGSMKESQLRASAATTTTSLQNKEVSAPNNKEVTVPTPSAPSSASRNKMTSVNTELVSKPAPARGRPARVSVPEKSPEDEDMEEEDEKKETLNEKNQSEDVAKGINSKSNKRTRFNADTNELAEEDLGNAKRRRRLGADARAEYAVTVIKSENLSKVGDNTVSDIAKNEEMDVDKTDGNVNTDAGGALKKKRGGFRKRRDNNGTGTTAESGTTNTGGSGFMGGGGRRGNAISKYADPLALAISSDYFNTVIVQEAATIASRRARAAHALATAAIPVSSQISLQKMNGNNSIDSSTSTVAGGASSANATSSPTPIASATHITPSNQLASGAGWDFIPLPAAEENLPPGAAVARPLPIYSLPPIGPLPGAAISLGDRTRLYSARVRLKHAHEGRVDLRPFTGLLDIIPQGSQSENMLALRARKWESALKAIESANGIIKTSGRTSKSGSKAMANALKADISLANPTSDSNAELGLGFYKLGANRLEKAATAAIGGYVPDSSSDESSDEEEHYLYDALFGTSALDKSTKEREESNRLRMKESLLQVGGSEADAHLRADLDASSLTASRSYFGSYPIVSTSEVRTPKFDTPTTLDNFRESVDDLLRNRHLPPPSSDLYLHPISYAPIDSLNVEKAAGRGRRRRPTYYGLRAFTAFLTEHEEALLYPRARPKTGLALGSPAIMPPVPGVLDDGIENMVADTLAAVDAISDNASNSKTILPPAALSEYATVYVGPVPLAAAGRIPYLVKPSDDWNTLYTFSRCKLCGVQKEAPQDACWNEACHAFPLSKDAVAVAISSAVSKNPSPIVTKMDETLDVKIPISLYNPSLLTLAGSSSSSAYVNDNPIDPTACVLSPDVHVPVPSARRFKDTFAAAAVEKAITSVTVPSGTDSSLIAPSLLKLYYGLIFDSTARRELAGRALGKRMFGLTSNIPESRRSLLEPPPTLSEIIEENATIVALNFALPSSKLRRANVSTESMWNYESNDEDEEEFYNDISRIKRMRADENSDIGPIIQNTSTGKNFLSVGQSWCRDSIRKLKENDPYVNAIKNIAAKLKSESKFSDSSLWSNAAWAADYNGTARELEARKVYSNILNRFAAEDAIANAESSNITLNPLDVNKNGAYKTLKNLEEKLASLYNHKSNPEMLHALYGLPSTISVNNQLNSTEHFDVNFASKNMDTQTSDDVSNYKSKAIDVQNSKQGKRNRSKLQKDTVLSDEMKIENEHKQEELSSSNNVDVIKPVIIPSTSDTIVSATSVQIKEEHDSSQTTKLVPLETGDPDKSINSQANMNVDSQPQKDMNQSLSDSPNILSSSIHVDIENSSQKFVTEANVAIATIIPTIADKLSENEANVETTTTSGSNENNGISGPPLRRRPPRGQNATQGPKSFSEAFGDDVNKPDARVVIRGGWAYLITSSEDEEDDKDERNQSSENGPGSARRGRGRPPRTRDDKDTQLKVDEDDKTNEIKTENTINSTKNTLDGSKLAGNSDTSSSRVLGAVISSIPVQNSQVGISTKVNILDSSKLPIVTEKKKNIESEDYISTLASSKEKLTKSRTKSNFYVPRIPETEAEGAKNDNSNKNTILKKKTNLKNFMDESDTSSSYVVNAPPSADELALARIEAIEKAADPFSEINDPHVAPGVRSREVDAEDNIPEIFPHDHDPGSMDGISTVWSLGSANSLPLPLPAELKSSVDDDDLLLPPCAATREHLALSGHRLAACATACILSDYMVDAPALVVGHHGRPKSFSIGDPSNNQKSDKILPVLAFNSNNSSIVNLGMPWTGVALPGFAGELDVNSIVPPLVTSNSRFRASSWLIHDGGDGEELEKNNLRLPSHPILSAASILMNASSSFVSKDVHNSLIHSFPPTSGKLKKK